MTVDSHGQTALVVASDRLERRAIVQALKEVKIRGRRALQSITEASEPYDAIGIFHRDPTNLVVFSLQGFERRDAACLRQMRRVSPGVRTLLVAAQQHRPDVPTFLRAGGDSLISSPFHPDELRLLARSLLRSDAVDPLTGLPNRSAGDTALAREMAYAGASDERRHRLPATLGFGLLDLDRFKKVNTAFGYAEADRVLRKVARAIREGFRVSDVVTRWGGEEFVVLLTGLPADAEEARRRACDKLDRVRIAIAALPIVLKDKAGKRHTLNVTLSGGLALHPHETGGAAESRAKLLFDTANRRLAWAKEHGRNRIRCVDDASPQRG